MLTMKKAALVVLFCLNRNVLHVIGACKGTSLNTLSPNSHTYEDPAHGTTDTVDMAFISPGLSSRDFSFSVADDRRGNGHLPIKHNIPLTEPQYKLDKTDMQ